MRTNMIFFEFAGNNGKITEKQRPSQNLLLTRPLFFYVPQTPPLCLQRGGGFKNLFFEDGGECVKTLFMVGAHPCVRPVGTGNDFEYLYNIFPLFTL